MNEDSGQSPGANGTGGQPLLPWADCDAFCINSYSGAAGPACGWRGRFQDARHDKAGMKLLCPRCGGASLLRLPPGIADRPEA